MTRNSDPWTEHASTSGQPDQNRSARRGIPTRVWIAVAAASAVTLVVLGINVFPRLSSRMTEMSQDAPPATTQVSRTPAPSGPLRSTVIPDLVLPLGTVPFGGPSTDRVEYWRVPLPFDEAVDQLRAQLPVGRPYGRLMWCGEAVSDRPSSGSVAWRWGADPDYLSVLVQHGSEKDSTGLSIGFDGNPLACRR